MTLLDDSKAEALNSKRLFGGGNPKKPISYIDDNPQEGSAVKLYLKGGARPTMVNTAPGRCLVDLEDAIRAKYGPPLTPPVVTKFGAKLVKLVPEPVGDKVTVSSEAALLSAMANASKNTEVQLAASLVGSGKDIGIFAKNSGITLTMAPGVTMTKYGQVHIMSNTFRLRGVEVMRSVDIKFDGDVIEVDRCRSHDNSGFGILFGSSEGLIQIWDTDLYFNGSDRRYDHNIYAEHCTPGSFMANCLLRDPWAYNAQIYDRAVGFLMSCCTLLGGQKHPGDEGNERGGVRFDGAGTKDCEAVGCISAYAPASSGFSYGGELVYGANCKVSDSVTWKNVGGGTVGQAGYLTFENCFDVDPMLDDNYELKAGSKCIALVQAKNFDRISPNDKKQRPRVTGDAGCHRYLAAA